MKKTAKFSSDRKETAIKLTVLVLIAALGALITLSLPTAVNSSVPRVNTVFPDIKSYTPAVNCTGRIEYSDLHSVVCDMPVVISSYNVSEGQHADEGQVIALVDVDATAAAVTAMYGAENILQSSFTADDIPKQIIADTSGTVCYVGKAGETIAAGEPVARIGQKGDLQLTAAVSQRDISKVCVGQNVSITAADKTYSGTVSDISGFARKEYDTIGADTVVDVSVTVDDATEELRSGYSAEGVIQTGVSEQILTLPYNAICQDDSGEYVYIFDSGSAKRKDISTGIELAGCAQVIGLDLSDEIIVYDGELSANCLVIRDGIVSKQEDGE